MSTTQIIVFPRGQLTAEDKEAMKEAGILAVEADDPKLVSTVNLGEPLIQSVVTGDAIVRAAVAALASVKPTSMAGEADRQRAVFMQALAASVEGAK